MPIIKCLKCQKEFHIKQSQLDRYKTHYCSKICKDLAQQKLNNIISKETHAEMIIKNKNKELIILFDLEDLSKINKLKWNAKFDKTVNDYYVIAWERNKSMQERKTIRLHNYLMNTPEDMECDHINRNPRDNRKCNLRNVEPMINKQNKGFYKNNKSGYKYIHFNKQNNRWRVEIKRNNVKTFYGSYLKLEDAIIKRNQVLIERGIIV